MTLRTALPFLALVLALCACGPATMSMETHMTSLGGMITTSKTDLDSHKTSVASAAALAAIVALEGPHATTMAGHMTDMDASVKDMKTCMKSGVAPDTTMMTNALAAMKLEDESHHTKMMAAADLAAARTEEERHQMAMGEQMGMMTTDQTRMMNESAGFMCPMKGM